MSGGISWQELEASSVESSRQLIQRCTIKMNYVNEMKLNS